MSHVMETFTGLTVFPLFSVRDLRIGIGTGWYPVYWIGNGVVAIGAGPLWFGIGTLLQEWLTIGV